MADTLVEGERLVLEAVARPGASARAREPVGDRAVEQEGEARPHPAARARVERAHRLEVEAARVALVGEGRIREAVAEDDLPRVERGPDDLTHVLRAVRAVEEELGERRQRGGVGAEQEAANGGPGRRAARLARLEHAAAARAEVLGEVPQVGRLAGALDALEGDEQRHGRGVGLAFAARRRKGDQPGWWLPSTWPMA